MDNPLLMLSHKLTLLHKKGFDKNSCSLRKGKEEDERGKKLKALEK